MEHAAIDPATYAGGILVALLAGLGSGLFLHVHSSKSTKKGLARMLCVELQVNHAMIQTLTLGGLPAPVEIPDDVCRGLLSSGNMGYLARHQTALHELYASMRRNDKGILGKISRQIMMLGAGMWAACDGTLLHYG